MLSVREITKEDIGAIASYWLDSDTDHMIGMGVELSKLPKREDWEQMLIKQISTPLEEKQSYALIWLLDGKAVGHCNINKIQFGEEAYMHLHLWDGVHRQKGMGVELVRMSIPYFFKNYQLKRLYCEPYALNEAPHRTLKKLGFRLVKEYITTPGFINFEQPVKLWVLKGDIGR